MRVALAHDWLTGMRGGERVLDELARIYPHAHLYTLVHVPGATSPDIEALDIRTSWLSRLPGAARHYRKLLPLFPRAIESFRLEGYDLVISVSHAVAKAIPMTPGTPHLAYCLTPMRYAWDQADAYLGRGVRRVLAAPLLEYLRRFDVRSSGPDRISRFAAISTTVAERVERAYGRRATLIFPPVEVSRFSPSESAPQDFYLLVSGFVPYKRDALALEAFRRLGRRLVVVGDGPGRAHAQANASPNIEFTGRLGESELAALYAGCRALIYPQEEDFGLVAVEAQAAGRPVIAYGRGGARDSVRPLREDTTAGGEEATGLWFDEATPGGLVAAVERFEKVEHCFDPERIRAWAERFGPERFRREFAAEIERVLGGAG